MKFSVSMFLLMVAISITSCKKESSGSPTDDPACNGCEKISAVAANDSTAEGVYKGLLLSGTGVGHFRGSMLNGTGNNFFKMIFTRETYPVLNDTLRYAGNLQIGPSFTGNLHFVGSGSSVDIYMVGNTDFSSGDFTLSGGIGTGPKPQSILFKETSTQQVKVYEGTMTGIGVWGVGKVGFVVQGNKIEGLITNSNNSLRESFWNGTLDADKKFSFSFTGNNSVYSGQLTDDLNISGSFSIQGAAAGTFTATRTL